MSAHFLNDKERQLVLSFLAWMHPQNTSSAHSFFSQDSTCLLHLLCSNPSLPKLYLNIMLLHAETETETTTDPDLAGRLQWHWKSFWCSRCSPWPAPNHGLSWPLLINRRKGGGRAFYFRAKIWHYRKFIHTKQLYEWELSTRSCMKWLAEKIRSMESAGEC